LQSGTVTPINTATNKPGKAIRVGTHPRYIVITPDGKTVYVYSTAAGTVTPIRTATNTALTPIKAPAIDDAPSAMAITPIPRCSR
jgi:YVTN family beta-propeller protein